MAPDPYRLAFYRTRRGDIPALESIGSLDERARAKIDRWLQQLRRYGPDLHRPMADVLRGPIRELRIRFGVDRYRLLFFIEGRTVVVTHAFRKKTARVPEEAIRRAQDFRADWVSRQVNL